MAETRVLLIDTDQAFASWLKDLLSTRQIIVSMVSGSAQGIKRLEVNPDVDAVLLEVKPPPLEDFTALKRIQELIPTVKVILMVSKAAMHSAVEGLRRAPSPLWKSHARWRNLLPGLRKQKARSLSTSTRSW